MTTAETDGHGGVGPMLRGWRERAGLSQLDLALRADSSSRHISFVETGRSRPSRAMVLRLAEELEVPVRERNALLVSAGHAPHYPRTPLDSPALGPLRAGLERMVTAYEPYPALVLEGTYEVLAANRGVSLLLEGTAPRLLEPPLNAMRITLHPDGLAPRIVNFLQWRGHLLRQMERQLALLRHEPLRELYEEVTAYPLPSGPVAARPLAPPGGPPPGPRGSGGESAGEEEAPLALPMVVEHRGHRLAFLSTIATFNTPVDVTVSELAVETFLPADPETAEHLRRLVS